MSKRFYQIATADRVADVNIYGNISSIPWEEIGEVSARGIVSEIQALDVDTINVYINSYGGEVAEAVAIYSALKRHSASVHTYCDGFACSAATIIFCAGDVRTMGSIALMMIHNCMSYLGYANSEEMRKAAEDNDKINQSAINTYLSVSNLSEDEIRDMMSAETWLTAQECLQYGFATEIAEEDESGNTKQSAFGSIRDAVLFRGSVRMNSVMQKLDEILEYIQKDEPDEDPDDKDDDVEPDVDPDPDDPDDDPDDTDPDDDKDDPDDDDDDKDTVNMARVFFNKLFS